jgi:hypothetical protein
MISMQDIIQEYDLKDYELENFRSCSE